MVDLMPQAFSTSLPSGGAKMDEKVYYTLVRDSNIDIKK